MNDYILFCQTLKTEKVCQRLNTKANIFAYIPKMETYIRKDNTVIKKVMFPGYLFIKTDLDQTQFDIFLNELLHERKDGIVKQLEKNQVSALTDDEISLLNRLLDAQGILRMSEGYKENGKTIVTKGPLKEFQDDIISTDKRDMIAVLNIQFLNRNIKAGLFIKQS